jgi:hypothetical protein
MKTCLQCNIEKEYNNFHKDKSSKDGLKYKCKECVKKYDKKYNNKNLNKIKQYYVNNKEKINNQSKQFYLENKENHISNCKQWQEKNKDKVKKHNKNFRLKNKIWFSIKNSINCRIWGSLKNKSKKHLKTEQYLGCTIEEYKQYLEQHFKPEMNWENHGIIWEIDHIKPCSSFDLTDIEQQKQCFHYINTQPLFKTTFIAESFGYGEIGNRNKLNNYD